MTKNVYRNENEYRLKTYGVEFTNSIIAGQIIIMKTYDCIENYVNGRKRKRQINSKNKFRNCACW